ncbi:hypothetical protein [Paenibacillus ehimensis]|uniref:DUF4025 domain-containing protein n=1 Tax=Paenibacillus ehimensis TaxID=79264 RepID=A0ABT8VFG0_9BACL|nr:hypothetical protein [Paenibacillus ehimensis]MDO3679704.1 hypothetical protein [Paenibacillus ehimensis]MEC0211511.1 hypothetical protein [Paenibacillus ehimensis]
MKESEKERAAEADRLNFYDQTDDVVNEVPATTDADEAVEAITSHINKYDVPDELEEK